MDGLVPSYKSAPLIAWSDILFTVHYWKLAQNPSLILNSSEIHLGCLPSIISLGITLSFLLSWNFLNFQMHLFIYSPTFLAVVIGTVDPDDIRQVSSSDLMGSLFVQRSFWCRESFFVCFFKSYKSLALVPGAGNYSRVCSPSRSDKMFSGLSLNTAKATLHPELPASNYSPCYCVWLKKKKEI